MPAAMIWLTSLYSPRLSRLGGSGNVAFTSLHHCFVCCVSGLPQGHTAPFGVSSSSIRFNTLMGVTGFISRAIQPPAPVRVTSLIA